MKTWAIALLLASPLIVSTASARTWYIKPDGSGDVPTIQAGVDSASHGDTLLCAAGTYSWNSQGTGTDYGMISILRGSSDMVIVSESGPEVTILNGQGQGRILFFQGWTELTVEGFTFKNGIAPALGNFVGGAMASHLSSPVVRDCVFEANSASNQGGAYWYGGQGSPVIESCHFENNSAGLGGAVFLINSSFDAYIYDTTFISNDATTGGAIWMHSFRLNAENCLIAGNTASVGGAIHMQSSWPSFIANTTIVNNRAATGAALSVLGATPLTLSNVIVALSTGGGAAVNVGGGSTAIFSCSDMWGNPGGNWVGDIAPQLGNNGNISEDPKFCSGGFSIQGDSPCAPGNHPHGHTCGVIGAYGVACGSVAVEQKSWGEIKAMYADD